jgi:membrane protein required for colicin V production
MHSVLRGEFMNILDWILIGIGILAVIRGIWRGAVSQIFGIVGVLGGFLLAAHHYQTLASQLTHSFPKLSGAGPVSFGLIFLLTWVCVGLLGYLVAKLLHLGGLGFMDRLLGAVVGLGKAAITAAILISILTVFISPNNPAVTQSEVAPHVQALARLLVATAPLSVRATFEQKSKELQHFWLEEKNRIEKTPLQEKKDKEPHNDKL